jgi:hypothetical protein
MKSMKILLMAAAITMSPATVFAGPGGHGGGGGGGAAMGQGAGVGHGMGQGTMGHETMMTQGAHAPQGSTNGVGWDHLNSPHHATGQPGFECEESRPGHASSAPGSAFNEDGNAGTHYAGEQPQNSRNTASVSQYDTACMHQR